MTTDTTPKILVVDDDRKHPGYKPPDSSVQK